MILLFLLGTTAWAQQVACIGWQKSPLENNILENYQVMTKDYRNNGIISPNAFCRYYCPTAGFKDKNILCEFNKQEVCIRVVNTCLYDDLKLLIKYMDDHFTRIDKLHWKSVDDAFLFSMSIQPGANQVEITTVAMPKPSSRKPVKHK
jgi:hypothetical protein